MDYENENSFAVWKHFLEEENGQAAMGKYTNCKKILKLKGGSIKGLYALFFHKINLTTATTSAS